MILPDSQAIKFDFGDIDHDIELMFLSDIHAGSAQHNASKWNKVKEYILDDSYRYFVIVGDVMENAIPGSKSDMFTQRLNPMEQQQWFYDQLLDLKDRCVGVVDGNHENNRTIKTAGIYPLYDVMHDVGISERYRHNLMCLDLTLGHPHGTKGVHNGGGKRNHYRGVCVHVAKDQKTFTSADIYEGIDFFARGHDHDSWCHPRAKMVFDDKNKVLKQKDVYSIDCGSFLNWGGYSMIGGYRPQPAVVQSLILSSRNVELSSVSKSF